MLVAKDSIVDVQYKGDRVNGLDKVEELARDLGPNTAKGNGQY
jgi:hypothetical protein